MMVRPTVVESRDGSRIRLRYPGGAVAVLRRRTMKLPDTSMASGSKRRRGRRRR